ncbi:MAG TPA: O-antigen ligase family protein, partial [Niastella sp.]|nr:O-antigen ligase family protein [Niastella sp.]
LLCTYCFLIYNSFREKFLLLRKRKEVVAIVLFYLLHIISSLLSDDVSEGFSWVLIRMPLFVLPVSLGLVYLKKALKERILYAYAVVTTVTVLVCILWGAYKSISLHDPSLLYNDNLTDILDKQSVYVALLVNLAVFSFGYLLSIGSAFVKKSGWVYACFLVLLVANFLLASRISITMLYGSIILVAVWQAIQKKKLLQLGIVAVAIAVVAIVLITFFPKTVNRFRELGYTSFDYTHKGAESHFDMDVTSDQWNGANIRLAVWSCGWEVIREHPVLGVQLGDKLAELMKVYKARRFDFAYDSRRNMHNNYLDIWAAFGIVGLLIFLYGFLVEPVRQSIKTNDIIGLFVIAAFMLAFVTETYFDRSMGNFMFGFFIAFIISYRKPEAKVV